MKAILVQPPFVQLNAPYPAVHYLEAFLRRQGLASTSYDHSIEVYRVLFSRSGLERAFDAARSVFDADSLDLDEVSWPQMARYLSYGPLWLEWIDGLVAFLSGADPAFAHRLASAAELPRGARASAIIEEAEGRIPSEEARRLATAMLEDLADLIRFALDPDFGTVRYGDRLARSRGSLDEVLKGMASAWFINEVYMPWLRDFWAARAAESPEDNLLVLVTIPFPGCLAGALACAREARASLGPRATIIFGGGYVSTELRHLEDPRLFDFCDYLSFDAGFGSIASILASLEGGMAPEARGGSGQGGGRGLWRTMYREDGKIVREGFEEAGAPAAASAAWRDLEREALETVFPDYASADFTRYLRAVDSGNVMHRLWSDTPWLKYSLAHGCYWRRCSFCDTTLDYVANYVGARVDSVMEAAVAASRRHGLFGLHFVDEAMPMASLLAFARENRARAARGERPFSYWGNVRFDASWTAGRCEFLAASGLVAVSGGIEIATERGLEMTNKGFGLSALVRCLVGMRRAGLLVHAYLIYGFPGQEPDDIVDSAEVVRQLFEAGLVDSAFWHRFVLTRGSRMMEEWRAGRLPFLHPVERPTSFADNDLEFEGEEAFDAFDAPLVQALESWMRGEELDRPAAEWLAEAVLESQGGDRSDGSGAKKAPGPKRRARNGADLASRIPPDRIDCLVAEAEEDLDAETPAPESRVHWIAGLPLLTPGGFGGHSGLLRMNWACRGEVTELELPEKRARRLAEAIERLAASAEGGTLGGFLADSGLAAGEDALGELLSAGLVAV